MKAKLIKTEVNYLLENQEGVIIASTSVKKEGLALSLNNCLEIENRYDLSALFCEVDESIDYQEFDFTSFRLGFQKAVEFLNKKFGEEDMYKMFIYGDSIITAKKHVNTIKNKPLDEFFNDFIQSLQQTEWDVEVEMICPHPMDTYRCGLQYGCDGDGCNHPEQVPSLDHDGCLILKRI
jgi:hypothetical protein